MRSTRQGQTVGYAIGNVLEQRFRGNNPSDGRFSSRRHDLPGRNIVAKARHPDSATKWRRRNRTSLCSSTIKPRDLPAVGQKDGGDVDAITAATISSRAYTDAVARAYKVFGQITGTTDKTGKEANHE
ncbi:MAG: FMN-binding protein [Alistipes indistinctus]